MEFKRIENFEKTDENTVINIINENNTKALYLNAQIGRLERIGKKGKGSPDTEQFDERTLSPPTEEEHKTNKDIDFENEVDYYLFQLKKLKMENIENEFNYAIPARTHYQYDRILRRLQLNSIKTIREIVTFLKSEGISPLDDNDFSEELEIEYKKIELIEKALLPKEEQREEEVQKNNFVFVETTGGNIRVLEEVAKMDSSYYEKFTRLFLSIQDGTFSNVKRFTENNKLNGLCEVKGDAVRVLFMRLNINTYALISAFIKKTDSNTIYRTSISASYENFLDLEKALKKQIEDPDFMNEQKEHTKTLFTMLAPKNKELQKRK